MRYPFQLLLVARDYGREVYKCREVYGKREKVNRALIRQLVPARHEMRVRVARSANTCRVAALLKKHKPRVKSRRSFVACHLGSPFVAMRRL